MDDPKSKKELMYAEVIAELGNANLFKQKVCDYVGVPVEKRDHPEVANWVIKWIKEQQRTGVNMPADQFEEKPKVASTD